MAPVGIAKLCGPPTNCRGATLDRLPRYQHWAAVGLSSSLGRRPLTTPRGASPARGRATFGLQAMVLSLQKLVVSSHDLKRSLA